MSQADIDNKSTEDTADNHPNRRLYPRVTSFRSRRAALTPTQQASWDKMWPRVGRDVSDDVLDAAAWFGRTAPLVLEVGCGTGTATAAMAAAEPDVDLLAVEVYQPGLAQLLGLLDREGVDNVRVIRGDAFIVLDKMIEPRSLTGVRVFFPDPWPKARHHKRRFLSAEVFSLIASRLVPGGVLHVATDHAEYAEHIKLTGDAEPLLGPVTWEWPISTQRPVTKFEGKAERVGNAVTELTWGRIGQ